LISADGDIQINAGVDMSWSRARLEDTINQDQLIGGNVTIKSDAVLSTAAGTVRVFAGGDVTLDAAANVSGSRAVEVKSYRTVAETIQTVTGYQQVAVGQIQVPEITWVQTPITEIAEYKEFKVGSEYTTMDVSLTQIGYYNPNAPVNRRFVEYLVEGLDYTNASVNWANAASEALPTQTATAPGFDYRVKSTYKDFSQLSDAQRQAVMNFTGYKPIFQFTYANAVIKKTVNGTVAADTPWTPTWSGAEQVVYGIDVAGWKDRYIRMPKGANVDILRVESQGQTKYLTGDSTKATNSTWATPSATNAQLVANDTQSDGQWFADPSGAALIGEYVGQYKEDAQVDYTQQTSQYYFPDNRYPGWANEPHAIKDDGRAQWLETYVAGSGIKTIDIQGRDAASYIALQSTTMNRDPEWKYTSTGNEIAYNTDKNTNAPGLTNEADLVSTIMNAMETYQMGRFTDRINADKTFIDALVKDTSNFSTTSVRFRYAQTGYEFRYWDNWVRLDRWQGGNQGNGGETGWATIYSAYTGDDQRTVVQNYDNTQFRRLVESPGGYNVVSRTDGLTNGASNLPSTGGGYDRWPQPLTTPTTEVKKAALNLTSMKSMGARKKLRSILKAIPTIPTAGPLIGTRFTTSGSNKVSRWSRKTAIFSKNCLSSEPLIKMSWCSISKTSLSGKHAPSPKPKRCSRLRFSPIRPQSAHLVQQGVHWRPTRSPLPLAAKSI
jgi:hypothetical protein